MAGDTIVSSPFHRFWKAGKGWVMARDLKPATALRTLDGLAKVESSRRDRAARLQPGRGRGRRLLRGHAGALVHDNTLPDLRLAPFDAAPSLGRE